MCVKLLPISQAGRNAHVTIKSSFTVLHIKTVYKQCALFIYLKVKFELIFENKSISPFLLFFEVHESYFANIIKTKRSVSGLSLARTRLD